MVAAAAVFLSTLSYVVIFRYVFCARMSWRLSYRIGMAEQAANSLLPAGGAGGLALGAWALSRGGMKAEHIARRTVAFFVLTSLPNFALLILFAIGFATGLLGVNRAPAFTYGFAIAAAVGIVLVLAIPAARSWIAAHRKPHEREDGRIRRWAKKGIDALADGVLDSIWLLRSRPRGVLTGGLGYCVFDIVALGACFQGFGYSPQLGVLVVAYLIGQLGGLLPLPGGIGGTELGLVGASPCFTSRCPRRRRRCSPTACSSCGFPRSSARSRSCSCVISCAASRRRPRRSVSPSPSRSPSSGSPVRRSAPRELRQPDGDGRQHLGERLAV